MTTNDNKKPFKPTFYVFAQHGDKTELAGVAYKHKKGKGMLLIIKDVRYVAFPPKAKPKGGKDAET